MGCEECGFYWNFPDEDEPCPVCESKRLRKRVEELEDQLRWRKWPEERPEEDKEYWVMRRDFLNDTGKLYPTVMEGWEIIECSEMLFRPIGNLPEGG